MSTSAKIILGIVVVVVVVGGLWLWMAHQSGSGPSLGYGTTPTSTATNVASSTGTPTTATSTFPRGNSDQAIQQDMISANSEMSGFSSDSASIDQGMSDQPVSQAE